MKAKEIKELRKKLNLSQENFAHSLGVSRNTIRRWENGSHVPSLLEEQRLKEIRDELENGRTSKALIADGKEYELYEESEPFIEVIYEIQKLEGGLRLYSGQCRWEEYADANRQPPHVPVKIYRIDEAGETGFLVATYFTGEDGKFYFVTKDDAEYWFCPATSRAKNKPENVKQLERLAQKQIEKMQRQETRELDEIELPF